MTDSTTLSVIVPAYNAERTLALCLSACLAQSLPALEVVVVDDGSTDNTGAIAKSFPVRYVRQENGGPAKARNAGARIAQGKLLAFTDSDCVPQREWLRELANGFVSENVVGVGGTYGIANPDSELARLIHAEIQMRHERFHESVDFLGSFNVAYRRTAFHAAGGFDETFSTASAEDNDLAYRLADAGGELRFTAKAVVNHYHPERLWPYLKTQFRHGFWRMKLYAKHPGRIRGDQYASRWELWGPPLSVLLVVIMPILWGLAVNGDWVSMILFAVLGAISSGLVIARCSWRSVISGRAAVKQKWRYNMMIAWRDFARGFGLIWGVWRFLVLRRETA